MKANFYEVDIKVDGILGYPWMKANGIVVCAKEGCLGLPDEHNVIQYIHSKEPLEVNAIDTPSSEDNDYRNDAKEDQMIMVNRMTVADPIPEPILSTVAGPSSAAIEESAPSEMTPCRSI